MNSKTIIFVFLTIGGFIGGLIPYLWGGNSFSVAGLVFSAIGSIFGIYLAYKLNSLY